MVLGRGSKKGAYAFDEKNGLKDQLFLLLTCLKALENFSGMNVVDVEGATDI